MSLNVLELSPTTKELLTQDAIENIPVVRLVKLPLMISDAECMEPEVDEGHEDEPPNKKRKIIPYKLKDSDKKTVYDSGTVIYTEEFKRSVWDYLCVHTLAEGELRYPEISHSVLYKWRRKALEEKGQFVPQRHVESRKSLLADLKKDKKDDDYKDRRYSEPPKVPKLKISLKLTQQQQQTKEEQKCTNGKKVIAALSDELPVEKKVRVVTFALQNSTQKAAEHYGLRPGEVHSYMTQNVIRRMALDRIRHRVTKGSKGEEKTPEEVDEIVRLARVTNVERAARQFGVKEGQVLIWMKEGPAKRALCNGTSNGPDKTNDFDIEFQMKVLDLARKQSLSRACKVFQIQPAIVQNWMKKYFPEEEVQKVVTHEEPQIKRAPIDADELEKMLYDRLQEPSSRIRAVDTGEIAMETIVSILKVALTAGSKLASSQFNIPRTTIATWITRNSLEELVRGTSLTYQTSPRRSGGSPPSTSILNGTSSAVRPTRSLLRNTRHSIRTASPSPIRLLANGDELEMEEMLMDANNNDTNMSSKEAGEISIGGNIDEIKSKHATVNGFEFDPNWTGIKMDADQIDTARSLGITMKCLARWIECRQHFAKLRESRLASAKGDTLKEILTFRLEAIDCAQKGGRIFSASLFRVTLGELHEWIQHRDSYMRALLGGSLEGSKALVAMDKVSDLIFENSGRSRAQAIADRLGLDLGRVNEFVQLLYSSF